MDALRQRRVQSLSKALASSLYMRLPSYAPSADSSTVGGFSSLFLRSSVVFWHAVRDVLSFVVEI
jgi:hypothetical protein